MSEVKCPECKGDAYHECPEEPEVVSCDACGVAYTLCDVCMEEEAVTGDEEGNQWCEGCEPLADDYW